jgi:hypothetical protein
MSRFGLLFGGALPLALLYSAFACSPAAPAPGDDGVSGGSGGNAASGGSGGVGGSGGTLLTGGTGGSLITGGAGGSVGATGGSAGIMVNECVGDKSTGQPVPLDVYVMLDISGSMLDAAGTGSKWDAVKGALSAFFSDPGSAGLTTAIQYFPLRLPGVPLTCTTDAECGAGAPCLMNICRQTPGALISCDPMVATSCMGALLRDDGPCDADGRCHLSGAACTDAASCQSSTADLGACQAIGTCPDDPTLTCSVDPNNTAQPGCGVCAPAASSFCVHENVCDPATYQTPAVEFAELPAAAAALNASVTAQMPLGDTPSRPALRGAIGHAREWAASHAGHRVVVVLATDGFPTECTGGKAAFGASDQALTDVVNVAMEGLTGATSIQTFVIGVFSVAEAMAQANLDRIAAAGGTERAYVIDTGGNVQQGFLDALNQIRAARLDCEYLIPQPPSGKNLNLNEVNFQFTDSAMMSTSYFYVAPGSCTGAPNEWHYDVLPNAMPGPTKIVACPATCEALKATTGGSIQIQLGCTTVVR